ncbi:MAG: response regulator [Kiritimatiellae bacterium]|nr:response regulator [Kiritimatiellia bacterium]
MAKILLVDDESGVLYFIQNMFQANGYEVVIARSGEEAIESVRKDMVDLVITDLRMPRMDGMELLRVLKRELAPSLPVIMLTAYASDETAIEAKKLGAFTYMAKPFNVAGLLNVVRRAVCDGNK